MRKSKSGGNQVYDSKIVGERIQTLCQDGSISYYTLSYRAAIPISTLMRIINGTTENPGIFTVAKICSGLKVSLSEFFNTQEFEEIRERKKYNRIYGLGQNKEDSLCN